MQFAPFNSYCKGSSSYIKKKAHTSVKSLFFYLPNLINIKVSDEYMGIFLGKIELLYH